jgi:hypothetical protein
VFTATALPPGARKTTVFAHLTAPLEEYEAEEVARLKPEVAAAQARYKIAEERLRKAQTLAAKAGPENRAKLEAEAEDLARELAEMVVRELPRLLADDTSPERLATLLRDQGGRMGVMSPEGGVFDLMAGRYSGNGTPNFDLYLKGHAGDTLRVDRVGRPAEFVRSPALTLGLAIQPDVLRGLADRPGFRGRGLLGRFAYSLPANLLGHRIVNPPEVPQPIRAAYHRHAAAVRRAEAHRPEWQRGQANRRCYCRFGGARGSDGIVPARVGGEGRDPAGGIVASLGRLGGPRLGESPLALPRRARGTGPGCAAPGGERREAGLCLSGLDFHHLRTRSRPRGCGPRSRARLSGRHHQRGAASDRECSFRNAAPSR